MNMKQDFVCSTIISIFLIIAYIKIVNCSETVASNVSAIEFIIMANILYIIYKIIQKMNYYQKVPQQLEIYKNINTPKYSNRKYMFKQIDQGQFYTSLNIQQ
ncbi:hypothetical protein pb186bvf_020938 [Paramecium bursaria]